MKPTLEEYLLRQAAGEGFETAKGTLRAVGNKFRGINKDIWAYWMPQWAVNAAENYPHIKSGTGIRILSDSARDIPAIVVGIGPSLDQQLEWIGRCERNAVIISTDAALRALVANGITPHLVCQLDCRPKNATMFDGVKTEDHILVTNACAHPEQLKAWKGRHLFYNMLMQGHEFTDEILPLMFPGFGAVESKGTVGNMAILIAHFMGCKPIIACGMDLCYQKVGDAYRYRANDWRWSPKDESTGMPERWEKWDNKLIYDNDDRLMDSFETTVKERTYRVDGELDFYRKALLEMVGPTGMHLVNCAEEGILRDIVETLDIEAAVTKYCQPAFEPGATIVPHLKQIIPMLEGSHAR